MNLLAGLLEANDTMSRFDHEVLGMRCTDKQLGGSINVPTGPGGQGSRVVKGGGRDVPDVVDPVTGLSRKLTALERRRYRETGSHRTRKVE